MICKSGFFKEFALGYRSYDMHDRTVYIRDITKSDWIELVAGTPVCADCGKKPTTIVLELNGESWYWCGMCDVGG
jgi:hypothetical protein